MNSQAIETFRSTPDKLRDLALALDNPAIQEALQLIQLANIPVDPNMLRAPVGLDADRVVSRKYHLMLGCYETIATLRRMATPLPQKEEPDFSDEDLQEE